MSTSVEVAVVSRRSDIRLAAARAFDQAPASWKVRLHEEVPEDADIVVFGTDLKSQAKTGLVFNPKSPNAIVEQIAGRLSNGGKRSYLVTGAGGGVGVTSIALHLAQVAAQKHRTCYVDSGRPWPSTARLGIEGPHLTWAELVAEQPPQSDTTSMRAALPVPGGFRAMPAPETFEHSSFERAIGFAGRKFERLVIDCSDPGVAVPLLAGVDAAVLVVPFTAQGARRAAKLLSQHQEVRWAIVLNRSGPGGELTSAAVHRMLGHRSALQLPCTPALRDAEDDSKLLSSEWSRYVRRIARLYSAVENSVVRD